ncbi:protein kinase [Polaromonas sp. C04]|uniref:protein kinase domain-containing protein n=1 Tax=Polaromonas sp. C04 TaxID=1945857 RepID=UPI0009CF93A9|nr:protein kinase [Polaromonas sp. C04]OOG57977.1 hypothetical protein B0E49_03800 [Polaromonas sp. C04]
MTHTKQLASNIVTVLVVDDDEVVRNGIIRCLTLEGIHLVSAANGRLGLEMAMQIKPDVVISDVNMPEMDGFQLLEAIRNDTGLASTQVMLLTTRGTRDSMRLGMTLGADDYLVKPFTDVELLNALEGLIKKNFRIQGAIAAAQTAQEERLRRAYSDSLGGGNSFGKFELAPPVGAVAEPAIQATVLFSGILGFTSLAEKLTTAEVAELLSEYFERIHEPVRRNGGQYLRQLGDGLMAVFPDSADEAVPAAGRAVAAALGIVLATSVFRWQLERRFADRGLPPVAVGIGLHAGDVAMCRPDSLQSKEAIPTGDAVNTAARLQFASKQLGWLIVASATVLQQAGPHVQTGASTSLEIQGKSTGVKVIEVRGMDTSMDDTISTTGSLGQQTNEVQTALKRNSEMVARAVKGALESKLAALKHLSFAGAEAPLRLAGYRILRRIGTGGMSDVYLAVHELDDTPTVLKVLNTGSQSAARMARFIQEYTLLSKIDHPNIVKIFKQGFSDTHAYTAMEYFERGNLRSRMGGAVDQRSVIALVSQIAGALSVIHDLGVVHRDLKPENLLLRADGSIVLTDFGIAKSIFQSDNPDLALTRHGDLIGTPSYMSPEQVSGQRITPQTDFYSLGVVMFELLSGQRPFQADTLVSMLALHAREPTPMLPKEHAVLQPVVDKLMLKDPGLRYARAQDLLRDLALVRQGE